MQAGYSVELGREDPALELPWSSEDGAARYFDLKVNPDLVLQIPEALRSPELSAFLARINAPGFPLQTAKCDLWYSTELSVEEEIFSAAGKYVSYIDLIFADATRHPGESAHRANEGLSRRLNFYQHEVLAKDLCALARRAPDVAATVELVLRHCYYHRETNPEESDSGFCITTYVSGFGQNETDARRQWSIALTLLQQALIEAVGSLGQITSQRGIADRE